MHILFVDESGTPPPLNNVASSPFFVLGGVIIPEEFWHKIKIDLESIKEKFKIKGEIKWRYFYTPQNQVGKEHSLSHLAREEKEFVRSQLFEILRKYETIRTICIVSDVSKAYELTYIKTPDELYWYSYKYITERFQYYLQDISSISNHKINGIIVCDHRAPNNDKRLQELHAQLLLGHHNANSNYPNLIEGVFIAPSHLSVGIQLADLVAGAVLRSIKDNDKRFFDQMASTLRKSQKTGEVEGYGIVRFPKT